MKKFLDLGSLASIVIALILIGYLYLPQRPVQATNSTGAFKDFPIGQARLISLEARREALDDLTPREQLDQMRDWLLFTAVSASGLSADEVNKALFDLPAIRHGYMQPVANFEYGDTRSCYLGNGQVLALVPADTSEERAERLARIADEQRKNLGVMPEKLLVFEYELKPSGDSVQQPVMLTRRDTINIKDLFKSSAGYYEAKIKSLDDLNRFMGQVDDLTYASLQDGLTVGGRKIKGHSYRGIRVEEIAALYQSEAKIRGSRKAFEQRVDAFKARCASFTYRTEAEKEEREYECNKELAALIADQRQASRDGRFADGSGFSLDPTFDFAGLATTFDTIIAPDIRRNMSDATLVGKEDDAQDSLLMPELNGLSDTDNSVEEKIKQAREGLANKDAKPLFELLDKVKAEGQRGEEVANRSEKKIQELHSYQAARYIGELKGTEVGMVLFYTDLLAKLWAMNYQNSAPNGNVPDFHPMTALRISSIYKQELIELSHTRLWFGPQFKGFQVIDKGQSMLFARTATRVYAASSNTFKPGVEKPPNANSAAFLGWWDDHYDEVARFEPEYERLNEIMKWSLVVTWLNQQEQAGKLSFLQSVSVERGHWFRDWVSQHPELRYTAWSQIGFYDHGYNGTETETLQTLESEPYLQFGQIMWLRGGVSLASEETFASRVALSAESKVAQTARRSNLNYALGESTDSTLKTLEGTVYRFNNASAREATTTAMAKDGAKLRGLYGEVANKPVERVVAQEGGRLNIGTRVGEVPLGDLTIGNAENGFRVGWASRDMDTGALLARRLSMSREPAKVLALDTNVEAAIKLPGNGGYFVKLEGSERWLKVAPERAPSASLEPGYTARVGDLNAGAQNYNLVWVKAEDVSSGLGKGITLRLRHVARTDSRYEMEVGSALDATGEPIFIEHNGATARGLLDPQTKEVSFAYDELPQPLRDNPGLLRRLVSEAKPSPGSSRYVVGEFNNSSVIEPLRRGDYRAAVRELVDAPDEFKAQLEAHLKSGIAECNGMMLNEQYGMASRRIEDLIQIYGVRDELRLHKLVVDLSMPRSTRNSLSELVTQGSRPTMMDEITSRLNESLRLGPKGESLKLVREGDDVAVRYNLSNLNGSTPLAPGEPNLIKAFLYVEDTPGLNNLDWQFSPQRTLDGAISGQFKARVIKLPRGDVARVKPAYIYDEATGVTFKAANTGGTGGGFRRPHYFVGGGNPSHYLYGSPRFPVPCIDDDDDGADDNGCDDEDRDTAIIIVRQ